MTVGIQGHNLPAPLFHKIGEYTALPYLARQVSKEWEAAIDQDTNQRWWGALFNAYVQHPFFVLYTKRALTLGGGQDKTMQGRVKEVFRLVVQDAKALGSYKRCDEPLSLTAFETLLGNDQQRQVSIEMRYGLIPLQIGYNSPEQLAEIQAAQNDLKQPLEIHDWLNANQAWLRDRGRDLGLDQWNRELVFVGAIRSLFPEIGFFHQLVKLHVSHNKLTQLPYEITKLTSLQTLNMSHNDFTEVPAMVFQLDTLTSLNVASNYSLKDLPEALTNLSELQSFDCDNTEISAFPKGFEKLKQLHDIQCPEELARTLPTEKFPKLYWLNGDKIIRKEIAAVPSLADLALPAPVLAAKEKPCNQQLCEFFSRCFSCIVETLSSCLAWLIAKFN